MLLFYLDRWILSDIMCNVFSFGILFGIAVQCPISYVDLPENFTPICFTVLNSSVLMFME
jgi:hypothetical protein